MIMFCVTSMNFSILINGEPTSNIFPSRGIRQRDPLSPYLFLLCTEGLTSLLNQATQSGLLSGVKVCRGAPLINYLLFADDSLIFCMANFNETLVVHNLLETYEQAFGHKINREKTAMVFSANVQSATRAYLCSFGEFKPSNSMIGILVYHHL